MTTVTDDFDVPNGPVSLPWGQLGSVTPEPTYFGHELKCFGASYQLPGETGTSIDFQIRARAFIPGQVFLSYGGSRNKHTDLDFDGYYCHNDIDGVVQISRKKAGFAAVLLGTVGGLGHVITNDIVRMTRVGNTISIYRNGIVLLSATDTTDPVSGHGYVGIFANVGVEPTWDNFTATYSPDALQAITATFTWIPTES